jgi:hypothetical protein
VTVRAVGFRVTALTGLELFLGILLWIFYVTVIH